MPKNQRQQAMIIGGAILVVLIGFAIIFGGDSGLFGTGADDAGDAGGAVDDSSAPPADSGGAVDDSSAPPADSGGAVDDSSAPPADSGGAVDDSSAPPADSGGAVDDSSAPPADSGGGSGVDTSGGSGTTGDGSTSTGDGSTSTGDGSTSTGDGSTSTGDGSTSAEPTAEAEATTEVAALAAPVASFGINSLGNGVFEFFDNSFSEGIASYTWTFGDGNGASGSTVQHTYAADGEYTVTLTITSAADYPPPVPDTQSQQVTVVLPAPVLTLDASANSVNLTVTFSGTATSDRGAITTWSWTIGGSEIGNSDNFQYTFASAGTYTVVVTAIDEQGNDISQTFDVTVAEAQLSTACVPNLQSDPNNPLTILASIASSENIASFTWDFGDGSSTVSGAEVSHTYANPATATDYTVTLICAPVENGAALGPITGTVTITPVTGQGELIAQFAASPFSGTPGTRFIFTNQSTSGVGITYSWAVTYPDGSIQEYSATDLDLTFNAEGTYNLTLTVSDGARSVKADGSVQVVVGAEKPIPDFTLTNTGAQSIQFSDASTGGEIATWYWEVRDDTNGGTVLATFDGAGPHDYTFASAIRYTVYMKVVGPGGEGNAWKTREIVSGGTVTANFEITKISNFVDGQAEVCFRNTSTNAQESYWTFDVADGTEERIDTAEVCHTYTAAGLFTARLRVVGQNGDAESEKLRQISIIAGGTPPVAKFTTSTTTIKINQSISFTNTSSNANTWEWQILKDNVVIATNTSNWHWSYNFTQAGSYIVRLIVQNEYGLSEWSSDLISVTASQFVCTMPDKDVTHQVYPTQSAKYTANISGLDGRSYTSRSWTVTDETGLVVASNSNSNEITVAWNNNGSFLVKFNAVLSDGSTCETQRQVSVQARTLVCNLTGINGSFIPGQTTTIGVQVNEEWRSSVVYEWTINGAVDGAVTGNTYTLGNVTDGTSYTISAIARINVGGETAQADCNVNINGQVASYPGLVCNDPGGTRTPLLGETVNFTNNGGSNAYGRTLTYGWRLMDGTTEIASGTGSNFSFTFGDGHGGKTYQLTYWVQVGDDASTRCAEKTITITVNTKSYVCTFYGDSEGVNDTTPAREASNYTYRLKITSSVALSGVSYAWTFVGIDGSTVHTATTTSNSITVAGSIFKGTDSDYAPSSVRVVASGGGIDCSGTLNLRPGDWRTIQVTRNFETVQVGDQVCVTNTSEGTWFPVGDAPITYELFLFSAPAGIPTGSLGAFPVGSQYCTASTATGSYKFYVKATTVWGLTKESSKTEIRVVTRQGINATANPNSVNTEALVTFTAVGTNIDANSYVWISPIDGSTKRGATVTFRIPAVTTETPYNFVVTGTGSLGQSTASVTVRAFPSGSAIAADFEPDKFGFLPGAEVCFTDQSSEDAVTWTWTFGDGETLELTEANYEAVVCHTYTNVTVGQAVSVSLRVTNSAGIPASARNTIRVLSELEGASSFGVDVQGAGKVCYTAQVSDGVLVSGWDFDGDGEIDENFEGTINAPCFIYAEDGKYLVSMNISQGNNTGTVQQQVNVNTSISTARPSLSATGACEIVKNQTIATFTVRNANGAGTMQNTETVTITAADGSSLTAKEGNTLQALAAGASQTFTVEGYVGKITFTFTHRQEQIGAETTCNEPWDKSSITVGGACIDRVAVFTITNSGSGDMGGDSQWRLYQMDGPTQGDIITSGTFRLASGGKLDLSFKATDLGLTPADLMNIRLVADQRQGHPGNSEPRDEVRNCGGLPSLTASGICVENLPVITVVNNGVELNRNDSFSYTVTFENPAGNTAGTLRSNNFTDNQAVITLSNQYGNVTSFTIAGHVEGETAISVPNCYEPELSVSGICTEDGKVAFVIVNTGGPTLVDVVYTINDVSGSISINGDSSVTINTQAPGLGTYTFASENEYFPEATAEVTHTCLPPFSVNDSCWDGESTHNFTIVNEAKYAVEYTWEVGDLSGTATAAVGSNKLEVTSLSFGGNTLTIKVNGEAVATHEFSEDTRNCDIPEISVNGACEEITPVITVTALNWLPNDSVAYTITYETGEIQEGTFSGADLAKGTFTVPDVAIDKGDITFAFGEASDEAAIIGEAMTLTNCNEPVLIADAYCAEDAPRPVVEIINLGGAPISTHEFSYIITYETGDTSTGTITAASFVNGIFLPELSDQFGKIVSIEVESKFFTAPEGLETRNCNPPNLEVAGACEGVNEGVSFTVTNVGGPMVGEKASVFYEVISNATFITSGTIADLITGASAPVEVVVDPAAYGTYTIYIMDNDESAVAELDHTCLPELDIETLCWSQENIFSFNVINENEYDVEYEWEAGYEGVDGVFSVSGNATASNGSNEVTVEGLIHGRGYVINLIVADTVIASADMPLDRCQMPKLTMDIYCNDANMPVAFVRNDGGPIFSTDVFNYTVTYESVGIVNGLFTLDDFVDNTYTLALLSDGGVITFSVRELDGISLEETMAGCGDDFGDDGGDGADDDTLGADDAGGDDDTAGTNDGPQGDQVCGGMMPAVGGGLPMINLNSAFCGPDAELGNADWQAIVGEPAFCPDWLAYHTNQVAPTDWEIFALGDIPNRTLDNNLSRGTGDGVFDFFPARSPDAKWIAFASNRDGNWEIYTTNVETGFTQRATVNEQSIDVDPVWSPDQRFLAYESNVDGNWEIRLLDLATGESRRLTDHPGNDLNPFFSPDSTKIVFQSDRSGDGNYQIYELDLATDELTLISDGQGNDVDPQYSNSGDRIAFRSIGRDEANPTQSGIFVMNADGSEVTRVSPAGGEATNHAWSPQDNLIAYQSNLVGGVFDIYTYDFRDEQTRLVTFNEGDTYAPVADVSPTWFCDSESEVIFTSFQTGDNNIYSAPSTPEQPVKVDEAASQMTTDPNNDRDPQNSPLEENASRGGSLPPSYTASN